MKTNCNFFHNKIILLLLLIVNTSYAQSLTYFVSSSGGNDKNDGLSVSTAWATLTKVNATTFHPGDKILFKSGDSWKGQLIPKGSGTEVSPIIIDMYGGVTKPYIDGNGVIGHGSIAEAWVVRVLHRPLPPASTYSLVTWSTNW